MMSLVEEVQASRALEAPTGEVAPLGAVTEKDFLIGVETRTSIVAFGVLGPLLLLGFIRTHSSKIPRDNAVVSEDLFVGRRAATRPWSLGSSGGLRERPPEPS
ncbi:hypothetical protein QR680_013130 [Steinernema hermaphroditum]|uniref:Uncharacterized protein n=1 Tax=Steinernema hermaphroditum TaxID=289476 RepID=A0AA39I4G8_9BILA|nr:hypothetical protein QR680_013130 [Steinernema hermaphroditum]